MTIIECETMPDAVKLPHVTYTIGVGGLYTHWRPIDLPETDKEGKE